MHLKKFTLLGSAFVFLTENRAKRNVGSSMSAISEINEKSSDKDYRNCWLIMAKSSFFFLFCSYILADFGYSTIMNPSSNSLSSKHLRVIWVSYF
jgi:hypothetical protein